jgi:hypothetical protein
MTTSPTFNLSKPTGCQRIEPWEFAYFQARNKSRAHELVLNLFENSGLSQADLARRMGKRPEVVSRLLGAPGNWGLDTLCDLLFAISGAEIKYDVQYPLDGAPRNYSLPDWLTADTRSFISSDTTKSIMVSDRPIIMGGQESLQTFEFKR